MEPTSLMLMQAPQSESQLQQLPDDMLRHIFHRLQPDPSALAFVSMAYKEWRRVVHDEDNFLRPFRAAHHSVPPLVGLVSDAYNGEGEVHFTFRPTTTTTGTMNVTPPTLAHGGGFRAYGCTHGRVLLYGAWDNSHHGEMIVWDPLTGEENLIPPAPGFLYGQSYGAALVCDADHAHDGDCHSSPFRVVFTYSEDMPDSWWYRHSPIHTFTCVYISKTRSWGGRLALAAECHLSWQPSAVAGNTAVAVYWITAGDTKVLEFHLETERLLLIDMPEGIHGRGFFLAPARDARLRLAGVIDNSVVLFSWDEDDGAWVNRTVLRLEDFPVFHTQVGHENGGVDDENQDELAMATMKPHVIGFSEQLDCIILQAEPGVFIISLESGQHQRVLQSDQHLCDPVYPYSTFYSPERRRQTCVTSRDNVEI